ncbi:MAG: hypothetical protein JOZ78_27000 [Chroococcidiopsidaceae cyanobacterium CP_BM_ER_R8_30]|nr:hypothetical protein [Chroococcidiopsidaceae cyanobacterium CP_BM_ER_R8_30]
MSRRILFWASLPLMALPFVSGAMPAAAASVYNQQKPLLGIESASDNHNSILLADWDVHYSDHDWDRQQNYDRYRRERDNDWNRWHRDHDWNRWHQDNNDWDRRERDNDWNRWHRDNDWYHH